MDRGGGPLFRSSVPATRARSPRAHLISLTGACKRPSMRWRVVRCRGAPCPVIAAHAGGIGAPLRTWSLTIVSSMQVMTAVRPAQRVRRTGYAPRSVVGENIAAGAPTADEVMQGVLDSPGHCANLMDPRSARWVLPTWSIARVSPASTGLRFSQARNKAEARIPGARGSRGRFRIRRSDTPYSRACVTIHGMTRAQKQLRRH